MLGPRLARARRKMFWNAGGIWRPLHGVDVSPRAWLLVAMAAVAFLSPLRAAWATDGAPWWVAFAIWAVVVVLTLALFPRGGADDR